MDKKRNYRVGKSAAYRSYIHTCLHTMYSAGYVAFTLRDLSEWSGLAKSRSMRDYCDLLVLGGWLSVEPAELRINPKTRTYRINSLVWFDPDDVEK